MHPFCADEDAAKNSLPASSTVGGVRDWMLVRPTGEPFATLNSRFVPVVRDYVAQRTLAPSDRLMCRDFFVLVSQAKLWLYNGDTGKVRVPVKQSRGSGHYFRRPPRRNPELTRSARLADLDNNSVGFSVSLFPSPKKSEPQSSSSGEVAERRPSPGRLIGRLGSLMKAFCHLGGLDNYDDATDADGFMQRLEPNLHRFALAKGVAATGLVKLYRSGSDLTCLLSAIGNAPFPSGTTPHGFLVCIVEGGLAELPCPDILDDKPDDVASHKGFFTLNPGGKPDGYYPPLLYPEQVSWAGPRNARGPWLALALVVADPSDPAGYRIIHAHAVMFVWHDFMMVVDSGREQLIAKWIREWLEDWRGNGFKIRFKKPLYPRQYAEGKVLLDFGLGFDDHFASVEVLGSEKKGYAEWKAKIEHIVNEPIVYVPLFDMRSKEAREQARLALLAHLDTKVIYRPLWLSATGRDNPLL